MHDTAMIAGAAFFEAYGSRPGLEIVEVGAMDVGNGALRSAAPAHAARYIGLDMAAGPSVDLVLTDPHSFPLPDASADLVVSSSCMEHDDMFWLTFLEMARIARPGGTSTSTPRRMAWCIATRWIAGASIPIAAGAWRTGRTGRACRCCCWKR